MLRDLTRKPGAFDGLGFRLRGLEMTRLETLVDAAFAFSITMLALSADRARVSAPRTGTPRRGTAAPGRINVTLQPSRFALRCEATQ